MVPASTINLALSNVRSLASKSFLINDLITDHNLDLLHLTETWLDMSNTAALIETCPPDYSFHHSARQEKRGGGIATIYSKKISCTKVDLGKFSSFEYLALVLSTEPALLTVTIYRPPRHIALFLPEFSELAAYITTKYDSIILNGDFNIHVNNTADPKAMDFLDLLENLEFTQHITEPTHQQGNTLDLVVSKGLTIDNVTMSHIPVSDHYCVFF